jgi:hypothetical protein
VIHTLLLIAVVLFVLWLVFHATAGAAVNLIWLAIIALVVLWLVGFFRRSATY